MTVPDDNFNKYCEGLLTSYKRRNTKAVTQCLESLCGFLGQTGDVVQTMFGGSEGNLRDQPQRC